MADRRSGFKFREVARCALCKRPLDGLGFAAHHALLCTGDLPEPSLAARVAELEREVAELRHIIEDGQ